MELSKSGSFTAVNMFSLEFDKQVQRDLTILQSLSEIKKGYKYYYYPTDGKFYTSRLTGFSRENIQEGIKALKGEIEKTLDLAKRDIDLKDPNMLAELDIRIIVVAEKLREAQKGFGELNTTYVRAGKGNLIAECQSLEKLEEELRTFKKTFIEKEIRALLNPLIDVVVEYKPAPTPEKEPSPPPQPSPAPQPSQDLSPPPPPKAVLKFPQPVALKPSRPKAIRIEPPKIEPSPEIPFKRYVQDIPKPFPRPKDKIQRDCNKDFESKLFQMETFIDENLSGILEEMKESGEEHRVYKKEPKDENREKQNDYDLPWTALVTKEGRVFFHYGQNIVPKGKGGKFKIDKRGFSYEMVDDVAKLSQRFSKIPKTTEERQNYDAAINEAIFLKRCSEKNLPNVAQTYAIFFEEVKKKAPPGTPLEIVKVIEKETEWKEVIYQKMYAHGNLREALERIQKEPDGDLKIKRIIIGMLRGLAALHKEGIVHQDLKQANIYLDEEDTPYIGDLGMAKDEHSKKQIGGSPAYIDPKMLDNETTQTEKYFDIWSLGMLMYELVTKKPWPWIRGRVVGHPVMWVKSMNEQFKDQYFKEPPIDDVWMHVIWETLRDPQNRPTAQELYDRLSKTIV